MSLIQLLLALLVIPVFLALIVGYGVLAYRLYRRLIRAVRARGYKSPAVLAFIGWGAGASVFLATAALRLLFAPEDLLFPALGLVLAAPVALLSLVRFLPERSPREAGRRNVRFPYRTTSYVLFGAATVTAVLGSIAGVNWVAAVAFLLIGGAACWRIARLAGLPDAPATLGADTRPPVLYIRPFAREAQVFVETPRTMQQFWGDWVRAVLRLPSQRYLTLEGYLGPPLNAMGPFVGLGNPLDFVPPEGAARLYADDERWMQDFAELAGSAACIITTPARSDQLLWELRWLRERGLHDRLLVLTPPQLLPTARSARDRVRRPLVRLLTTHSSWQRAADPPWDDFVTLLHDAGYTLTTQEPGPGAVIGFDQSAQAVLFKRDLKTAESTVAALHEWVRGRSNPEIRGAGVRRGAVG
jgi:hypothetical protein